MNTLIELFDSCQIENIASFLKFKPKNLYFIGFSEEDVSVKLAAIKKIIKEISPNTRVRFLTVPRHDYGRIADTLQNIIAENEDCWFDLTGGKELVLVAMGAVSNEQSVPMYQMNIEENKVIRLSGCENMPREENCTLSLEQSVILNCGIMTKAASHPITADYINSTRSLWNIAASMGKGWNKETGAFIAFQKNHTNENDRLQHTSSAWDFSRARSGFERLFKLLENEGLINVVGTPSTVRYTYKNAIVREILEKSDNILETYTYIAVKELENELKGEISDTATRVFIKWVDADKESLPIKNEIDVACMHGLIPVFISCKNGDVEKNTLYELDTVTDRLGGEYSKKLLIATYINALPETKASLLSRAEKMNITVIGDVDDMDFNQFKDKLKEAITD